MDSFASCSSCSGVSFGMYGFRVLCVFFLRLDFWHFTWYSWFFEVVIRSFGIFIRILKFLISDPNRSISIDDFRSTLYRQFWWAVSKVYAFKTTRQCGKPSAARPDSDSMIGRRYAALRSSSIIMCHCLQCRCTWSSSCLANSRKWKSGVQYNFVDLNPSFLFPVTLLLRQPPSVPRIARTVLDDMIDIRRFTCR